MSVNLPPLESDVIGVADLALIIGRTEPAIRMGVHRKVDWLPPHFYLGRKLAWRRSSVEAWLAAREKEGQKA